MTSTPVPPEPQDVRRLQRAILSYSALTLLVLGSAVAVVGLVPLYRGLREERQDNLLRALEAQALTVGEYRNRAQQVAQQISSRTTARRQLEAYNRGELDLAGLQDSGRELLLDALQQSRDVVGITRLDANGQPTIAIGTTIPAAAWPIPPHRTRTAAIRSLPLTLGERTYLVVGSPIVSPSGDRVGTDIVLFEADKLQQIVADFKGWGATGTTLLGTVEGEEPQPLFPRDRAAMADPRLAAAIVAAGQGEMGLFAARRTTTVAYSPVADSTWAIVAVIDSQELYAPVWRQVLTIGGIASALILLSTGGMVLLLRPLAGRITLRAEELAEIVRSQTAALQEARDALERRVAERTAQLSAEVRDREQAQRALQTSEARLAGILDNAKEAIISIDADYRITLFNRGASEIFGYPLEEVLDQPLDLLLPDRFRDRHRQHVRHFSASSDWGLRMGGEQTEIWGRRCDGTEFPAEATISKLQLGGQTIFTAVLRDVSDRKTAEDALRRSEERLRLALKAANQGLYDLNLVTDEAIVSPEYSRMLGFDDPEEFQETAISWRDRLHPEDREGATAAYRAYAAGDTPQYRAEFRLRGRDGWKWILSLGQFVEWDAAGKPIRMLGTHTDISARKETEAQLQRLNTELAASNRELEQFAYVASHDLQEPLRLISSYTELLAEDYRGQLNADADEYIHFITGSTARLQRLIQDLLAFSRIGTRGRDPAPVDCNAILQEVCRNLKLAIAESQAEIVLETLPTVLGDRSQLVQLWQNLVANAIKFRSDAPPRIEILAECQGDVWRCCVRDNGIGIAPQYAERIFEIFQRLHARRRYEGTGIGLAICRRIVERHGGEIWVESSPDCGAAFYFTLPTVSAENHEPADDAPPDR